MKLNRKYQKWNHETYSINPDEGRQRGTLKKEKNGWSEKK
jgi:hypothetical protein